MKKLHETAYKYFTPNERLNLVIAAMSRQDTEEVNCLQRNCPIIKYTASDLKYNDYFISYTIICVQFYTLCAELFTKITAYSYTLLLETQKYENKAISKPDAKMQTICDNQDLLIAKLKAVYDGFYQFCNEAGLNATDILKTINFGALNPACYLTMEHVTADDEYTKEIKALFEELWRH